MTAIGSQSLFRVNINVKGEMYKLLIKSNTPEYYLYICLR